MLIPVGSTGPVDPTKKSAEELFSLPICVIMMLYRRGAFYMLPIRADMESAPTKGYVLCPRRLKWR